MLLLPVDVLPAVLLLPVLLLALPFDDDVDVLRLGVRLVTVLELVDLLELVDVLRLGVLPELPDTALLVLGEELRVT